MNKSFYPNLTDQKTEISKSPLIEEKDNKRLTIRDFLNGYSTGKIGRGKKKLRADINTLLEGYGSVRLGETAMNFSNLDTFN